MGKLLMRGLCVLMLAGTGCTGEGPQGPRAPNLRWLRYDAGAFDAGKHDSGRAYDAAAADGGDVDVAVVPLDASFRDADARDADASILLDAQTERDAAQPDAAPADAAQADAASESDAGSNGPPQDAGGADAGDGVPDSGMVCGYLGLVAGNDCPGVVSCQDNNGAPVLSCTLRESSGAPVNHCCVNGLGTGSNSCRKGGCGLLAEATCDGPEDCSGGNMCCRDWTGATSCQATCLAPDRLYHRDRDCPSGWRCRVGSGGTLHGYEWWGFCRSEIGGD